MLLCDNHVFVCMCLLINNLLKTSLGLHICCSFIQYHCCYYLFFPGYQYFPVFPKSISISCIYIYLEYHHSLLFYLNVEFMSFNYLIIYCTVVLPMVLCRILPPVSYISKITNGCHQPFCQSTALFLDSFNFSSFSQLFSSYMGEYCF